MWSVSSLQFFKPVSFARKSSRFIDREFQVRHTLLLLGAAFMGIALTLVPIYFFINQNYKIFFDIAYENSPQLIQYLERERIWINTALFGVFLGLMVFFSILGFRMTARIVGPIQIMTNHLRHLSRGQWYIPEIKVRENDEFQELVETYNYFYNSFQGQLQKDIIMLKKMVIDPSQKETLHVWMDLLQEKSAQLNKIMEKRSEETLNPAASESPAESRGSRRVS